MFKLFIFDLCNAIKQSFSSLTSTYSIKPSNSKSLKDLYFILFY